MARLQRRSSIGDVPALPRHHERGGLDALLHEADQRVVRGRGQPGHERLIHRRPRHQRAFERDGRVGGGEQDSGLVRATVAASGCASALQLSFGWLEPNACIVRRRREKRASPSAVLKEREDLGAVLGDRDRVLEVRGPAAVGGHDGPAVVEQARRRPCLQHTIGSIASTMPSRKLQTRGRRSRSWGLRDPRASRCRSRGRRTPSRPRSPRRARRLRPRRRCRRAARRAWSPRSRRRARPSSCRAAAAIPRRSLPTGIVIAASPCQPSMIAPQSIDTMSPSSITRSPGMPCTITSLGEMQATAGKPW